MVYVAAPARVPYSYVLIRILSTLPLFSIGVRMDRFLEFRFISRPMFNPVHFLGLLVPQFSSDSLLS